MQIFKEFGIQPILLLAQIINFLIILYLLKRFFYGPIIKVLDDRKKRIAESLKNADLIEEKLRKTEEKSAQILEEARNNAREIINDAKKEAERIYTEAAVEARKLTEETLIKANDQIAREREQMQKDLEKETLTLVAEIVKKVLGRNLKTKERQDLTTKALSEITKQIQ